MKIALIGMPTCGKSTVAQKYHEDFNISLIDVDKLLEQRLKTSLQEYIEKNGESKFLIEENNLLINMDLPKDCIISTGGSVIYATEAMIFLQKSNVYFIYLQASLEKLEKRLKNERNNRGIVMNGVDNWHDLLIQRDSLYRYYAEKVIETDNKKLEEVINEIKKIDKK